MPSADRYARYRSDQTTIWVSKNAATFLGRERESASESVGAVLDRMINELRRGRRGGGAPERSAGSAAKAPARKAAASPAKRAAKSAGRSAAKSGAKRAAKRGARR